MVPSLKCCKLLHYSYFGVVAETSPCDILPLHINVKYNKVVVTKVITKKLRKYTKCRQVANVAFPFQTDQIIKW